MAKGNSVSDRIKVANEMTWRWEDYPVLSRKVPCKHKGPNEWKREAGVKASERWQCAKGTAGFEDEGRGRQPKNAGCI